ncbi:hypothetical protein D0869_10776 [Hortaea werneckii]|uniref:Zn(2)-C6 fungal-type domain-containing protein n=1 Tax=Hortaea werneckii TaxID=91943 RepID=A0A3M6WDP6_HORWE|nr:hypothetical protein D0869_10776 [Hortaea werneckii]RMX96310.1 hypothetical protein D0868_11247 [Hortaea werneckii]
MVYRGKPSAGCENCRKAKKRCTLEQPACARCVKLKKPCSGYRDTSQLQIQDETEDVRAKASKQKAARAESNSSLVVLPSSIRKDSSTSVFTPAFTESTSSSDDTVELPYREQVLDFSFNDTSTNPTVLNIGTESTDSANFTNIQEPARYVSPAITPLKPTADELAYTHFFASFTSSHHWDYLRDWATHSLHLEPVVSLAIRACGMASLNNIENVNMGSQYARALYAEALGLLNTQLRDPARCVEDEALIAVSLLGYFENLVCDSRESIQSWKAHMSGATQLLKLRGRAQFTSGTGRILFRETRAQILIHCIWDDLDPPSFLWDWQHDLQEPEPPMLRYFLQPADTLARLSFEFAKLRADIAHGRIPDSASASICADIDRQMIQWASFTLSAGQAAVWNYHELDVPESPHVWNGMVHAYAQSPAPGVWNTYRVIRILVTRSQELLCRRLKHTFTNAEQEEQAAYFRRVRRQMTDEICAGVPPMLGHAGPKALNSSCPLTSAYSSIWPLFFAGTCALERIGPECWEASLSSSSESTTSAQRTSAASAQAGWVLGRLEFISRVMGLRWAEGIAAVLRGDFRLHRDLLPESGSDEPPWIRAASRQVNENGQHSRVREVDDFVADDAASRKASSQGRGPIWTGAAAAVNQRAVSPLEIRNLLDDGPDLTKTPGRAT